MMIIASIALSSCCNTKSKEKGMETKAVTNPTIEIIHQRKSVRNYTDQKVSDAQVDSLLAAAMAAPTGKNRQPWEFIVVTDREVMNLWAEQLPYAKMLKQAQLAIVVCGNSNEETGGSSYWEVDCSAATQNLLLAAESMGLGAVWTAAYPYDEREKVVRDIYKMPEDIRVLNIIPIGYPTGKEKPKDKYKPEKIHFNRW